MLRNFYNTLDEEQKRLFVKKLQEVTGWSIATFYYKLSHDNLSILEQDAINKLIKKWPAKK